LGFSHSLLAAPPGSLAFLLGWEKLLISSGTCSWLQTLPIAWAPGMGNRYRLALPVIAYSGRSRICSDICFAPYLARIGSDLGLTFTVLLVSVWTFLWCAGFSPSHRGSAWPATSSPSQFVSVMEQTTTLPPKDGVKNPRLNFWGKSMSHWGYVSRVLFRLFQASRFPVPEH